MGNLEQDKGAPLSQNQSKESASYLIFKVGGELYGCPLLQVREVVRTPVIKPLPESAKHLKGIANLRGYVLSIVDLKSRLGMEVKEHIGGLVFVVEAVVESKNIRLGVMVDAVESVIELAQSEIDTPLNISTKADKKFFIGVAKSNESLINLLNLEILIDEMVAARY